MRYIKKFFLVFLLMFYRVKLLRHIAGLFTPSWIEVRKFVSIENCSAKNHIKYLCNNHKELYYCAPSYYNNTPLPPPELTKVLGHKYYAVSLDFAIVIGGSNLILLDEQMALYDIKFNDKNKRYKYTDEAIRLYKNDFLVLKENPNGKNYIESIKCGIYLGGNYSWNFYHLLFEILVKLELIDNLELDKSIPILVDKICLERSQFLELLSILNKGHRTIVVLEKKNKYLVETLYYLSCPNFIPPNFIEDKDIRADDVLFDLQTIVYLRTNLLPYSSNKRFPTKIFISRSKASGRRQFNEREVFLVLEKFGFVKIYPEDYSISDQISLFNNADYIIGGAGAAFTNLLFCKPKCKAVILSKWEIPFSGFSTYAKYIGLDLIYFAESSYNQKSISDIHQPFIINNQELETFILGWLSCK